MSEPGSTTHTTARRGRGRTPAQRDPKPPVPKTGKTSVWLSDDLAARWKATGLTLPAIIEAGLHAIEEQGPGALDPVSLIMHRTEYALRQALNDQGLIRYPEPPAPPEKPGKPAPEPRKPVRMRRPA